MNRKENDYYYYCYYSGLDDEDNEVGDPMTF